uniref:Uncharacterized protein n=1 Tax=mine drainage metagenome TaxID=410659 RepID=E6PY20_9ZZZZ
MQFGHYPIFSDLRPSKRIRY